MARLFRLSITTIQHIYDEDARRHKGSSPASSTAQRTSRRARTANIYGTSSQTTGARMDPSDITYILALTRHDLLLYELEQIEAQLSVMTSRLSNLPHLMKTLEKDLQIPTSDSSNSLLLEVRESLSLGRVRILRLLDKFSAART